MSDSYGSELENRLASQLSELGLADSATGTLAMLLAGNAVRAETARESNAALATLARVMAQVGALLPRTPDDDDPLTAHLRAV